MLRTETAMLLRRYARRVKDEGVSYIKAQYALHPDSDPDEVAREALARASQGMFLPSTSAIDAAPSTDQ